MVLADNMKKPHPYFGALQLVEADGKDTFIHLNKKAVLYGSLFSFFFIFEPRHDIDVSAIYSHCDCTRMIGSPNLYSHIAKAL